MKNIIDFKISGLAILFGLTLFSCKKEPEELWQKEIKNTENVELIDISGDFFNPNVKIEEFKAKYPWFQGGIPDADYVLRRKDTAEIRIYQEAIKNIDKIKLKNDLSEMFSRVKSYFPKFQTPKVYLYSSSLQGITDSPIFFRTAEKMLFIDISAFMGEKNKNYNGIVDNYLRKSMNPENILPKTAEIVAETFMMADNKEHKFIDQLVFFGKIKTLQNAFLPNVPDYLKMNYTKEQMQWSEANEANIWNYFVENDLIFSDDSRLYDRFIAIGPFSKFYTEVDQESSPQAGIFIGWEICKAFYAQKPDTKLVDFLRMNSTEIFNASNYKPNN